MNISKFNYVLPKNRIAQTPASPRDSSHLLVIDRKIGKISHHHFYDLPDLLTPNDVLVFNETKVIPARIIGKKNTGGKVEILLNKEISPDTWEVIFGGKLKVGSIVIFEGLVGKVLELGNYIAKIQFNKSGSALKSTFEKLGKTPLPPYIVPQDPESKIRRQYQTVYARLEGSVAAPTAGLHFTRRLLEKLKAKGIQTEYLTLHVGLGTFAPVKEREIEKHHIHSEYFELSKETANRLNKWKSEGKRIIAVGTTTTRVLETVANENSTLKTTSLKGMANLFIYPPRKLNFVDALITNFHLPESTLLALVSAFVSYPNTKEKFKDFDSSLIGKAYREAIKKKYRFYSFGDASLII